MIVSTQVTPDAELPRKILASAAHLMAAKRDPTEGLAPGGLSLEVRDSLEMLQEELDRAGFLAAYKQTDGSLSIW